MKRRLVILTEIIAPYRIPVVNALARHEGIDVHVIFLAETDPTIRQWLVYKDEIRFSYEVLPSWRRRIKGHNILLNRGLIAALRRLHPDVILCGGYSYLASWQLMLWARRNRVPIHFWLESTAKDHRNGFLFVEFLKRMFLDCCDSVVVPGKSSFDYACDLGFPKERIFTAPNAVDIELFAREADAARKNAASLRKKLHLPERFFLFVGRLVAGKGVFDLLEAYGKLPQGTRDEVGLVFVGDGVSQSELARRAAAMAPDSVLVVGFVHREDLPRYYALAEALVFPTLSDPWGLVVNEAMACGLPIIASNAAGCVADLVKTDRNGFVISPGDSQQLALAMNKVAERGDLPSRMGRSSREIVQHYSPQQCADGIARAVLSCGAASNE